MHAKSLISASALLASFAVASPAQGQALEARQFTVTDAAEIESVISSAVDAYTSIYGALQSVPTQFTSVLEGLVQITPAPEFATVLASDILANGACAALTGDPNTYASDVRVEAVSYFSELSSYYSENHDALASYRAYVTSVLSTTLGNICTDFGGGSSTAAATATGSASHNAAPRQTGLAAAGAVVAGILGVAAVL